MFLAIFVVVDISLLICLMIRSMLVTQYRINLIQTDYEKYRKLPSPSKMAFTFWRKIDSDKWIKNEETN